MAALPLPFLRSDTGQVQFDYTQANDERIARHLKNEFLNFFPSETAIRACLICPEDRFSVAYPARSMGLFVPHGVFKIVDDIRNCVFVFERLSLTPAGANIAAVVHEFLGLSEEQLDESIQLCTRAVPWFDSGVPVATALTYVGGLWVPLLNHIHAGELGLPRFTRWVIQTDALDLWIRDLATNLTYELSVSVLARGICVHDLIQLPEFIDKPGALIKSNTAARDLEPGEDWTHPRPGNFTRELELTTHRYWVWRNQFSIPQPSNPLDSFDDAVLALISLARVGQAVETTEESDTSEDDEPVARARRSATQPRADSSDDSLPDLIPVSNSSDGLSSLSSASSDGPASHPGTRTTWEEYLFSAHGARWLRNHARPRHGASPVDFYDYESDGVRSA
ncbi:hypothetical protein AURDEDRAFT_159765 [Auricularia subglabra TFB-10046 SS5]|nr:hypothetical protein AURDEDRAFT_159765 [Auricularia subglabra TFB-10046 SS5]